MRKASLFILVTASVVGIAVPAAASPRARRVFVVLAPSLDPFVDRAVFERDAALGLLSTRTGASIRDPFPDRAIRVSLGAGRRARAGDDGGALGVALRAHGVAFVASPGIATALRADPVDDVSVLRAPGVAIVQCSDLCVPPPAQQIERVGRDRAPDDVLMVLAMSPDARRRQGVFLGRAWMSGSTIESSLMYSPTTRRSGVLALEDVAPTILSLMGLDKPTGMTGRAIEVRAASDGPRALGMLEAELVSAARARSVMVRSMMWAAMILLGGMALLISFTSRVPASGRATGATLIAALVALPVAMLVASLLPRAQPARSIAQVAVVALLIGVGARALAGPERAIGFIGAASAAAVIADLLAGAPLASRSPLSFLIAQGARFYGIGNELMGVVLGGAMVGVAVVLRRGGKRILVATSALLAGAIIVMTTPTLGAKFGAALTAVPAFGILAARAGGRRVSLRLAASLGALTVVTAVTIWLADRLRPVAERSHISGIGGGGEGSVIERKLDAAKNLLSFSVWMNALLVFAAVLLLLLWRRRALVSGALRERPALRAALEAGGVAIVGAVAFNDAGLIAAAIIAMFLCSALLVAVLDDSG